MSPQQPLEGGLAEPEELEPEQGSLALAAPEDGHGRADWERAAAAVLRKAHRMDEDAPDAQVWAVLTHTTLDGLEVTPLGAAETLVGLSTSGRPERAGGWDVRTRPTDNASALVDLDNGADSLWLPAGVDLESILKGVRLDLAPVVLEAASPASARSFLALLGDASPAPGTNLGADPAGEALIEVAELARGAGVLAAVVDATSVHEQGASEVQELGWAMATAATCLRTLETAGFSVEEAAALVELRLAATDEQFLTIAKLRAARRLWARMLELAGVGAASVRIHAVTSRPMMSRYDPWVNMLRTTVAAFAAGVGGADSVTVVPFDSPLGEPDEFGRRIARNTSHLLLSESHLGRVADPAGGAYVVERLTEDLAVAAWEELGRIESEGLRAFGGRVAAVAAERGAQVAHRSRPLTGLTEFPDPEEVLPERGGEGDDVRRWGAAFEALRDDPATTPVFLATMGTVASYTTRAGFVSNLLAAGGVPLAVAGPTASADDLVAAYRSSGTPSVACLAGADTAYDDWGSDAVGALRGAGATHVVVAAPAGVAADLGADEPCFAGMDVLEFLRRTRQELP